VQAIGILHAEHRSLAAVLHGMLYLVRDIRLRGTAPRFDVLGAMVYYINAVPERFHHPKEDAYLFRRLALRCQEAAPLIDQLQTEHRLGAEKIRALDQALERYRQEGAAEFPAFAEAVQGYAAFHWDHMRTEEDKLIPLALAYLTSDDWKVIDAAFTGHSDPLFGAESEHEYERLFRRIVNLAPPPLGVGPAQS
jgi:branched-chain amino acid transport system ATP-binding protein